MQLATFDGKAPYICTVYFVHDEKFNFYWASWPDRRHSQHIKQNPSVAAAIVISSAKDKPVIGLQIAGVSNECQNEQQIRPIAKLYAQKFGRTTEWVDEFSTLKTKHRLYRLEPETIELFDEQNFPEQPQQKIDI